MQTTDPRQTTADAYYAEGCRLVDQADALWAKANSADDYSDLERAAARQAYEQTAARAVSKFHRFDALLDVIQRDPR